jgi:curved DNA-binding protein CbpA
VNDMGAAGYDGAAPDLYELLGVPRGASREDIAAAWRRRARADHPDVRPAGDTAAAGRFQALAEAWQVLGDPARRASYDRDLARGRPPAARVPAAAPVRVPVRYVRGPAGGRQAAEPPLRAGPVRVEQPGPSSPARGGLTEEEITLAIVAGLAARYLGRPW